MVRLLLARTGVRSGSFWQEQGCSQVAFDENKSVVRLLLEQEKG